MRQEFCLIIGILMSIGCTNVPENGSTSSANQEETTKNVLLSATEFQKKLSDLPNAQLIDVRRQAELQKGLISGSKNLDFFDPEFKGRLNELDRKKPVLVYCHSGKRSAKTASILAAMGFEEVYDLDGGYVAWQKAGL